MLRAHDLAQSNHLIQDGITAPLRCVAGSTQCLDGRCLKPLTGMNHEQYRVYKHRFKLSTRDKAECTRLDTELPELKQRAATAPPTDKALADVELYKARKQFNDLNC